MSQLKGFPTKDRQINNADYVTTTAASGDKIALDVNIAGGSVSATITGGATEAKQDTQITALNTVNTNLDAIEALITTLNGYCDGLETAIASTNTKLDTVIGHVDGIEALITTLNGYVDGLETLIASTNSKLDDVNTNLGQIEGYVDGLEGLVTSTNSKLDDVNTNLGQIEGYVDGLEALVTSTNSKLDDANTNLGQIEGYVDGLEALNTDIESNTDPKDTKQIIRTTSAISTAAYTELDASLNQNIRAIQVFNSTGETLVLATGAAASEVDKAYIFPGGQAEIPFIAASTTRLSVKAISATTSSGELTLNLIGV